MGAVNMYALQGCAIELQPLTDSFSCISDQFQTVALTLPVPSCRNHVACVNIIDRVCFALT
jgi:hypothetical protein